MFRAYGEMLVQVSVDVEAKDEEEAGCMVVEDVNEVIANMKEAVITTIDGKQYRLVINGFNAKWELIEEKEKRATKSKKNLAAS